MIVPIDIVNEDDAFSLHQENGSFTFSYFLCFTILFSCFSKVPQLKNYMSLRKH